jgi:hypothetical protein
MTLSPVNRCNELHKGQYVLYLFKKRVHLRKKHLPGVTTDTQERFYFPCNKSRRLFSKCRGRRLQSIGYKF